MMNSHEYIVQHHEYESIMATISKCHNSFIAEEKPQNLRLEGVSGVGKSTLLSAYRDSYPRYDTDGKTIVPILYICLPSRPSENAIYSSMLDCLGDPFAFQGRTNDLRMRLIKLINGCEVQMLIIDEIHHLLDRGRLKTHMAHADALKMLMEDLRRPVILSGAPRSFELFRLNTQLRGRFKSVRTLMPFSICGETKEEMFKKLVRTLMKGEGFTNPRFFEEADHLQRLFYATDGILRNLVDLLAAAYDIAFLHSSTEVSMPYLSEVFQTWIRSTESGKKNVNPNPFGKNFIPRRLTLRGELYELSELDGDNHGWNYDSNSQ